MQSNGLRSCSCTYCHERKWNYHAIQQNNANKLTDINDNIKIVALFQFPYRIKSNIFDP